METLIAAIEAAGKGGLPVIEYNFYAHRAIEGYYETVGRANAGYTGFDYDSNYRSTRTAAWWAESTGTRTDRSRPKPWPRSPTPRR